jgi:SHS2 domain-containing protein
MEPYKFFDHTADIKFQAYGKTLEDAFIHAADALFASMVEDKVENKITKSITIQGSDLKSLLYNFLEEFIYLVDSDAFLLSTISALKINQINNSYVLTALIHGDYHQGQYKITSHIKAVTYDQMEIKETPQKAMVQVVLDI